MEDAYIRFRLAVSHLVDQWLEEGLPTQQGLHEAADELDRLRQRLNVKGLWKHAPCMVTATMDDGLGQGLAIIEKFAAAIGIRLVSLGLMRAPLDIADACRREVPEFLGMTVLQFDTEEELLTIARQLPPNTRIVAGGPVFTGDPDFATRTGTHYAARNVAEFLQYMVGAAAATPDES